MKGMTSQELRDWIPPSQPYIIADGILPVGTKMVLYGKFATWKSMLSLHSAYTIANGKQWFGHLTHPTACYLMQTEVPTPQLKERTVKYLDGNKMDSPHVWQAYEPYTKLDKGFGLSELEKELTRTGAKLLVVDPMYKVVSGRLTDLYDMMQFFDRMDLLMQKFHLTLVILHHPRKAVTFEGKEWSMGGDDMFGSMLQNWCDTSVRTSTLVAGSNEVMLTFDKARHAPDILPPINLIINRATLEFTMKK